MSVVSSLFIFSLCLSLHACNARRLGVIDNGGLGRQLNSPSKVVDKVKPNMDSTQKGAERGESIGDRSHGVVISNIQNPKESKAFRKEMKYTTEEAISGNEIVESSSHVGLLKATRTEDYSRWQARTVLELGSHAKEEEATYSTNYNSVNEVTEQIDYEPAHRRTPIHNK